MSHSPFPLSPGRTGAIRPISWGQELGWDYVLNVLERCHKFYGDDRYRPCPLLRHLVSENAELGEGNLGDSFMI